MKGERTVFVQFPAEHPWTDQEVDHLADAIQSAFPEQVNVVATPDDVEFLTEAQVQEVVDNLSELLDS